MKRAEAKTQTFNQILKQLETQNAERLIEKARTANRLAKSSPSSRTRRHAYRVKVDALLNLRRRFPARTSVRIDPRIPSFVIVQYASPQAGARCDLHAPARDFAC
ncbi:MAG: hypothetical protein ICV68_01445 [Pyrinomonadaceae bacterium]|nr:hypothetical protein [Pyrinomonadaceae bacterium]